MFETASNLSQMIETQQTTSVDICNTLLTHISSKNSLVNAIVAKRPNADILAEAAAADARAAAGVRKSPIDGIPFTLKSIYETEGLITSTGLPSVPNYIPMAGRNSDIANILREAGGILIGKTNSPGGPVFTETVLGRTKNPHNLAYTTAGSSGGSAAAVAAGLSVFDIGSDAAGSIRMPASYCGVYGFKPSQNVISNFGDVWPTTRDRPRIYRDFCAPGPFARSIEDIEILMGILNRPTVKSPRISALWPARPRQLQKVVVLDRYTDWYCNPVIQNKLNALCTTLTNAGVEVIRAPAFTLNEARFAANYDGLWYQPQYVIQRCYPSVNPNATSSINNNVYADTGSYLGGYLSAMMECDRHLEHYMTMIGDADVVISPSHAVEAPQFGTYIANSITYMCMSILFNFIGAPSLSMPLGKSASNVPFGIQVAGRPNEDYDVLHFAKQINAYCPGYVAPTL